jgi:hypothetical protein
MRAGLAGLVALLAVTVVASPAMAGADVVFRFRDPAIVESSSLVDLGSTVVTANDSGNAPDLFDVDARTGETVGVTHLQVPGVDIEALAPAGGSHVWVGDIGDNNHERPYVSVARAPVTRGRLDVRPTTPSRCSLPRTGGSTSSPRPSRAARSTGRRSIWRRDASTRCSASRGCRTSRPTRRCSPTGTT